MAEEVLKQAKPEASTAGGEPSLLDEIVQATKVKPSDESYSATRVGVQAFIDELLKPGREGIRVTQAVITEMIANIDQKLSTQVDAILHDSQFQKLESAWRGLKFLVERTDFRENIKISMVNLSKEDLLADFEDAPELTKSGLYKMLYTAEYGQFGGQPYGAMVANYEFGPGPRDISLLQSVAATSAMAHAPFIAAAGESFFGVDSFEQLPNLKDLKSVFEGPQHAKWRGFRESEDSRNVGLVLPRFLLRLPYGPETIPSKNFEYRENVSAGDTSFLWGNAAFAFASCLTDSFAKYRWCANVIGPQGGGAVYDLPVYTYEAMGATQAKIPTQTLISERREFELAEEGFIALAMRKGSDNAAFFSANSCQKPKFFGNTKEGKEAETNYKLGTQLPYMFVISRLTHYIKVLQRENIGTWKQRTDLETELNNWIRQYVADQESPSAGVRSRRPLRRAEISVNDIPGDPGWYGVTLKVMPHFKYMGANFELSLVGKLDKE
ncbi:type VI secretion protein, EvpB/VC_A0108 family [Desulfocurvibacter africanus subsp. africanus str. Walvis Bay]|uniref:Type VI secretion protein, EvpB/VC_A0108 family n=1 Tax=Desulfocurvibacter africanus subsp. africanus str. Walvis Bay TaxID=690850 RepID=F3YX69_DESAF|nr:type VI secretion system contractile sheath large subunit [Desulfocurvibacter africanus]EGJ50567.1 type VI secretion protein, EvpB/VC_A0108 family [Desulfocurvibacter africanus subsp. africanus str. Walvis Bay]